MQESSYHSLPLPDNMSTLTSLCHVESRREEEEKEEEGGRGDWVVGVGGLTVLLWYSLVSRLPCAFTTHTSQTDQKVHVLIGLSTSQTCRSMGSRLFSTQIRSKQPSDSLLN